MTIPTHCWAPEVRAAVENLSHHVLLDGPPGVGKSTWPHLIGLHRNIPVFRIQCGEFNDKSDAVGFLIPRSQGDLAHVNGPASKAFTEPGIVLIDEIDRTRGTDLEGLLYPMTDNPDIAELMLPTGQVIKPKPGFRVFATTNESPESCLPRAILSRFHIRLHIDRPPDEALTSLPPKMRDFVIGLYADDTKNRETDLRDYLAFNSFIEGGASVEVAAYLRWGRHASTRLDELRVAGCLEE